jgi:TonB-dependent starch-binding outer membrane protein SusC
MTTQRLISRGLLPRVGRFSTHVFVLILLAWTLTALPGGIHGGIQHAAAHPAPVEALGSAPLALPIDTLEVSGIVVDENTEPLPGVNIRIRGTNRGTATDGNGTFAIRTAPADSATLVFSFIGYKTVEREVATGDTGVIVEMHVDETELDEVIVTGYGMEKTRTELVGSVAEISGEEIQPLRPEASFQSLLAGQIAGLNVTSPSGGDAGKPISIRIRGQGSLPTSQMRRSTSSEPLYIIDGVPLYDIQSEQFTTVAGREELLNPLAAINPDDIKSISVLKDASAAAIYGANAANGVILIETKEGSQDGFDVEARVSHGVSSTINEVKLLNSEQYVRLYRETLINDGATPEEAAAITGDADTFTDWNDLLQRNARFTNASISFSGGTRDLSTRVSLNYNDQETISRGNNFEKYGFRSRIDYTGSDLVGVNLNTGITGVRKTSLGGFGNVPLPPTLSPYDDDGNFNNADIFRDRPNPLAVLEQNNNNHNSLATTNSLQISTEPVENWRLRALGGVDYYQNRNFVYLSRKNATGDNDGGELTIVNRRNRKWITNLTSNYSFRIGSRHGFSTLLGAEAQEKNTRLLRGTGNGFLNDDLRVLQGAANREDRDSRSSDEYVSTLSGFGELSYNYNGIFYTSLNARRDASSIFGGDVRNANFASLGASYIFSQLDAITSISWLDFLKLKGSFGSTGNSRIGSYAARGLYSVSSQNAYAGRPGLVPSEPENTRLTWEKNYKVNAGIDATVFGRLDVLVEYYRNTIVDAISTISLPRESGFTSGDVNAVDMRNTGIELTLGYSFFPDRDGLEWDVDVNAATNRNVITEVKLTDDQISRETGIGYRVGEDVRTLYGIRYVGVDPENGAPLFGLPDGTVTRDFNLATTIENRQQIGSGNPNVFGGFSSTFSWKNLSVSVIGDYSFGSDILVDDLYATDGRQISFNNQSVNQLDRWQEPGDVTDVPRLSEDNPPIRTSNKHLYNLDYVKWANATLRYTLPDRLADRVKANRVRAFVNASNIGYIYFGDEPSDRNGAEEFRFRFPEGRTITMGVDLRL